MAISYQVGRKIGVGGMAEVLLARQTTATGIGKLVVLKQILPNLQQDPRFVQMFLAEAQLVSALSHPNIVEIYDIGQEAGRFRIVMEYLSGETLRRIVKNAGSKGEPVPLAIACRILLELADGLHYAHTATDGAGAPLGIVHRDVSLANIIVTYDGVPKLLDFGVAKANSHGIYTRPGQFKGKYAYCSPEQIQHQSVDHRSDLFSFGVVAHELLTGQRLFRHSTPAATIKAVMEAPLTGPRAQNPAIPEALNTLVLGLLHRDRAQRLPSADAFAAALEGVMDDHGLICTRRDLSAWICERFQPQMVARRAMEQEVASRQAPVLSGSSPGVGSFTDLPPIPGGSLSVSVATHASRHSGAGSMVSALVSTETSRVATFSILGAVLLATLAGVFFWLGRKSEPLPGTQAPVVATAAPAPSTPPRSAPQSAQKSAIHVRIVPAGAKLRVDGAVFAEAVGEDGVLVPLTIGHTGRFEATKAGYYAEVDTLEAPASGVSNLYLSLRRIPTKAAPTPVGTSTAAPTPAAAAPAVAAPSTPSAAPSSPKARKSAKARKKRWRRRKAAKPKAAAAPPTPAVPAVAGPVVAGPARGKLSVRSEPPGAQITIDGVAYGAAPLDGLSLAVGRVAIVATASGRTPWRAQARITAGRTASFVARLDPLVAAQPAAAAPAAAPVEPAGPAPLRLSKSRAGNARSGAGAFRSKCGKCHGRSASAVSPRAKTIAQWSRYFARGRHHRRAPLAAHLSLAELANIKAFLQSKAADARHDTAAGVR